MHAVWLKIVFLYDDDGVSKENLHFDDQSKQAVFLFSVAVFSKGNRKHVVHVFIKLQKHL